MSTRPLTRKQLRAFWKAYKDAGYNVSEVARRTGDSLTTWQHRIRRCKAVLNVKDGARVEIRESVPDAVLRRTFEALVANGGNQTATAAALGMARSGLQARLFSAEQRLGLRFEPKPEVQDDGQMRERLIRLLKGAATLDAIAERLSITRGQALDRCEGLRAEGFNVFQRGDRYSIEAVPQQLPYDDALHLYESDERGRYRFGLVTDNHLGSKYAREDVLHDLYDWFEREGVKRVYNAGNWIDGEARFNRHDLLVHGMDAQLKYFADRYPQRDGMTTYFIAGDDHEGWYAKDGGIDIGKRAEQTAREAGRADLRYLGYMESYIRLRHAVSGREAQMLVVHPGGGSSYAISYAPQKYVEALQGGEKPAVVLFGHWHKMDCFNYRNVWIVQGGTTEDQTPFMRKQKLEAHVGGMIVELEQDELGAIPVCVPKMRRYFDRGYYNNQFNMAGDITRHPIK
jgi:biotin operon repressor